MKTKILFTIVLLTSFASIAYCQDVIVQPELPTNASIMLDFSTFTGLAAIVTTIVTQLAKKIAGLQKPLYKIGVSILIGIALSFISWYFQLAPFLFELSPLMVAAYGLIIGLSGCGFYDTVKSIFKK